jgi:hypothetical protein
MIPKTTNQGARTRKIVEGGDSSGRFIRMILPMGRDLGEAFTYCASTSRHKACAIVRHLVASMTRSGVLSRDKARDFATERAALAYRG